MDDPDCPTVMDSYGLVDKTTTMESTVDHESAPQEDDASSSSLREHNNTMVMDVSIRMIDEEIARATAEAVACATYNQRSDSILSLEEDSDCDGNIRYMTSFGSLAPELSDDDFIEAESIEATVTDAQRTKLMSKGRSILGGECRSSTPSDTTFNESVREWERTRFVTGPATPLLDAVESQETVEEIQTNETIMPDSTEGILRECGALTLSLEYLQELWKRSEDDIITALYDSTAGKEFQPTSQFSYNIRPSSNAPDSNILLLHSLFATFCKPPPSLDNVRKIYERERSCDAPSRLNVELPKDALIAVGTPEKGPVVKLLRSYQHLLFLSPAFQLAFFRILTRLLTNKTDEEYEDDCLLSVKWGRYDCSGSHDSKRSSVRAGLTGVPETKVVDLLRATHERVQKVRVQRDAIDRHRKEQSWFVERMRQSASKQSTSKRPNQVYAIVRFHAGDVWEGKTAVSVLLHLLDIAGTSHPHLLPPIITLIGILCTAHVAVDELLRMLQIAAKPVESANFIDRVLMVKALTAAAEGDSQSTFLVGKASPKHFFTFGRSPSGLSRTVTSLPNWPFRNDFGAAVWFRCESFDQEEHPILLSISSRQGAGIDVSLMPLEDDKTASVIVVTVRDAGSTEVEQAIVKNCVLLPRVWYHLGVRHTRSRLKGVFSLSSRQQISVMLDGKLMLTEPLKFPCTSGPGNETTTPTKSFLAGLQLSKLHTLSLTVQFGAHFEGQAGALYLFCDNVSDATLRALYHVTAGTRSGLVRRDPLTDETWNKNSLGKAVVELNSVDADEVVMAQEQMPRIKRWSSSVVDLCDADDPESDVPVTLSGSALNSKLFLVWDPKRVEQSVVIDLHSGAHATMDNNYVQSSYVDGVKDVIASIGGVQALLPIIDSLLSGRIEHWNDENPDENSSMNGKSFQAAKFLVPSLFLMMAAFLRSHDKNAREMVRCGGIDIFEQRLLQNREMGSSTQSLVGVIRTSTILTNLLVDSLLELRLASEHYAVLESTVFSRLLFNMPLWFGGSCRTTGISLYPTLLPVLSSLTNATPHKVRNTVGVRPFVELLHVYTDIGDSKVCN